MQLFNTQCIDVDHMDIDVVHMKPIDSPAQPVKFARI